MAIKKGRQAKRYLGQMREKGAPSRASKKEVAPGQRWWKLDDEKAPGALMATIQAIHRNQSSIEQETTMLTRLYGGRTPGSTMGVPGALHQAMRGVHPALSGRLTYNVIAIVIDSLVSKITKENLSVQFLTSGGDYRQQRRAKKLSQFADGITYETNMDELGADVFRDACLAPVGIVHTYPDWVTKRVKSERCLSTEFYVDYADGFYGEPTQAHRVKMMDRWRLVEAFPEHEAAIMQNHDTGPFGFGGEYQGLSDQIAVAESWHLPSGIDDNGEVADDGKHLIYISNALLTPEDEREWKKMRFPFSTYRWKKDTEGWHGIPLARDLIGSQVEMNHLLIMFQRAFRMMAAFRIWIETGTVPDQHFQDKIGTILHGPRGSQPPQFLSPPAMNEQYFRHFDAIKARAFEIARLSQLSAVGQKPAGLDSGEAQRVYHDIESEGFSAAAKGYENFRLDVVRQQIDAVRDIFLREKKYQLRAPVNSSTLPGQRFLRSLDWKSVKLDEEEYILRGYSTSSLPNTPAGKLATVQDMMRGGLIDSDTGRKLLNFPDLAQVQSLLGAAEDWITSCLDSIVEDGKFKAPDPFMLLPMAMKLGVQEYSLGAANGMEEKKLDLLRKWVNKVEGLQAKASKAQQDQALQQMMQQAKAQAAIQAQGAPAPVSPMLPPGVKAAA